MESETKLIRVSEAPRGEGVAKMLEIYLNNNITNIISKIAEKYVNETLDEGYDKPISIIAATLASGLDFRFDSGSFGEGWDPAIDYKPISFTIDKYFVELTLHVTLANELGNEVVLEAALDSKRLADVSKDRAYAYKKLYTMLSNMIAERFAAKARELAGLVDKIKELERELKSCKEAKQ